MMKRQAAHRVVLRCVVLMLAITGLTLAKPTAAEADSGWTIVARSSATAFRWPRQTRAFGVTDGTVHAARFRFTAVDGGRLAQLELLARDDEDVTPPG